MFLNHVIINKTKVLLPEVEVILADVGYRIQLFWHVLCSLLMVCFFFKFFYLIIELFMMKYNHNIIGPKLLTFVYKI
jgi:hypothetical protein